MKMHHLMILFCGFAMVFSCKTNKDGMAMSKASTEAERQVDQGDPFITDKFGNKVEKIKKSPAEWKASLDEQEYYILREAGTERAFSGDLYDNKKAGLYTCAGCDVVLFSSGTKFDSGTGWPSFYMPDDKNLITEDTDHKLGYPRTEVRCRKCDGHLGHVFKDGPEPTGLRYCINSYAMDFIKAEN